jgi:hypothetical protein
MDQKLEECFFEDHHADYARKYLAEVPNNDLGQFVTTLFNKNKWSDDNKALFAYHALTRFNETLAGVFAIATGDNTMIVFAPKGTANPEHERAYRLSTEGGLQMVAEYHSFWEEADELCPHDAYPLNHEQRSEQQERLAFTLGLAKESLNGQLSETLSRAVDAEIEKLAPKGITPDQKARFEKEIRISGP